MPWLSNDAGLYVLTSGFADLAPRPDVVLSTRTGGSGKWFDDFPLIHGQSRGFGAAAARSNLLAALNADYPSYENGTTASWFIYGGTASLAASTDCAFHGLRSLKNTALVASTTIRAATITVVTPGSPYTAQAMFRGIAGKEYKLYIVDNAGNVASSAIADGGWQFITVTRTIDAAATWVYADVVARGAIAGEVSYWDAIMLNAGATPLLFVEEEALATSCTVPAPISAGDSASFLALCRTPWPGDDGVWNHIYSIQDVSPRSRLFKNSDNKVYLQHDGYTTDLAVDGTNWPAGRVNVVAGRLSPTDVKFALNGVLSGALSGAYSSTTPVAAMTIGNNSGGTVPFNGVIDLAIWKRAMGDRELVRLSHRAMQSLGI